MNFDIPKKWLADRIEQFGEDEECTTGNPNFMNNTKFKVILLSGCSLLGKSFYALRLATLDNFKTLSSDTLRWEVTGNESDMSQDNYIWNQLIPQKIKLLLDSRQSFTFDATMLNRKARNKIIQIIKDYNSEVPIECHYFEPNLQLSLERNKVRERTLPEFVIHNQVAKWQVPTLEEGFSKIVKIN